VTVFDYVVLGIVGVSLLLSLIRGFFREFLGLASWVVAALAAQHYAAVVALQLPSTIPTAGLRMAAGFVIVFLGILLIASLLAIALAELFKQAGLGWLDRGLGALFGLARGLLIVCILVLLGGMTTLPQDARWRNAMFSAPLEAMVVASLPWLPPELSKHIKFD
jgi:membrane protein required for colicin V production